MFKKILVIRIGNIGDVLFITPIIRILRKNYPQALLDIVTSPQAEIVVKYNPYLNNIFVYKKFHRLQRLFARTAFIKKLKSREYDLCVVLESNDEYTKFASKVCPQALRIGIESDFSVEVLHKTSVFSRNCHAVENYLKIISDSLNIPIIDEYRNMDFFFPEPSIAVKNQLNGHARRGFFVIHPSCSSGMPYRGWEISKLADVAKDIVKYGLDVFITGAALDKEPKKLLSALTNEPGIFGFLNKNLYEVAYLLKNSQGVICYDTGLLHMAQALDVKAIALFGPSDYKHTGPYGKTKVEVISKNFDCGPCQYTPDYRLKEKQYCLDGKVTKCMSAITVDEVIAAVSRIIEREK